MPNYPNKLEAALAALPSADLPALTVMARVCGHSLATKHAALLKAAVKEITALRQVVAIVKETSHAQ
jgi:hypothetical protein